MITSNRIDSLVLDVVSIKEETHYLIKFFVRWISINLWIDVVPHGHEEVDVISRVLRITHDLIHLVESENRGIDILDVSIVSDHEEVYSNLVGCLNLDIITEDICLIRSW